MKVGQTSVCGGLQPDRRRRNGRAQARRRLKSAPPLIIGYGSPLRGDDAFGYRAAERIPGAIAVHQLTPELMDPIARARHVIFLDASAEGAPGEIRRRELAPAAPGAAFTHHATPEGLLAGALTLYGHAPPAEILTVCGANFSLSTDLSPAVAVALESVVGLFRTRS